MTDHDSWPNVRFDLELIGGAFERGYRRLRPEVEAFAWGSLDCTALDDNIRRDAQARWTLLAFNEYRTSSTMTAVVQSLIEAQAPLDLVAYASTFVMDELVHAELAARMAVELGGAAEILFDPTEMRTERSDHQSPIVRAGVLVIRVSSVSEVLSSEVGRALLSATKEPLAHAVLGRIMRDERKHAALGAAFLDWADDALGAEDRRFLADAAQRALDDYRRITGALTDPELPAHTANPLAWFSTSACRSVRDAAIRNAVIQPLARRGIAVR